MKDYDDMMIPAFIRIKETGEEAGECRYEIDTAKGLDSYREDLETAYKMGYARVRPLIRATVCGMKTATELHANGNFRMYAVEKTSDESEWLWLPDSREKNLRLIRLGRRKSESIVTIHRAEQTMQDIDMERKIYEKTEKGMDIIAAIYPEARECAATGGRFRVREDQQTPSGGLKQLSDMWLTTDFDGEMKWLTPLEAYMAHTGESYPAVLLELYRKHVEPGWIGTILFDMEKRGGRS